MLTLSPSLDSSYLHFLNTAKNVFIFSHPSLQSHTKKSCTFCVRLVIYILDIFTSHVSRDPIPPIIFSPSFISGPKTCSNLSNLNKTKLSKTKQQNKITPLRSLNHPLSVVPFSFIYSKISWHCQMSPVANPILVENHWFKDKALYK